MIAAMRRSPIRLQRKKRKERKGVKSFVDSQGPGVVESLAK
jgi:hypothetical protein